MLFHDATMEGKKVFRKVTEVFCPNRDFILFSSLLK